MRNLPFLVQPNIQIEAVGNPEIGIVHLIKRGGIAPIESPVDAQKNLARSARYIVLLNKTAQRLAEELKISEDKAYDLITGSKLKDANADETDENEAVEPEKGVNIYKYMSDEEATEFLTLRDNQQEIAIRTATLFIRHRVLYPVRLIRTANPKAKSIDVDPLGFDLEPGDRIRYKGITLTVAEKAIAGEEVITVEPVSHKIEEGSILYLLDEKSQLKKGTLSNPDSQGVYDGVRSIYETHLKERMGRDEYLQAVDSIESSLLGWTDSDTREKLTEALIQEIYEFSKREQAIAADADETPSGKGKGLPRSNNSPTDGQSTGQTSTGESSLTVSEMNGSVQKTLVSSHSG